MAEEFNIVTWIVTHSLTDKGTRLRAWQKYKMAFLTLAHLQMVKIVPNGHLGPFGTVSDNFRPFWPGSS